MSESIVGPHEAMQTDFIPTFVEYFSLSYDNKPELAYVVSDALQLLISPPLLLTMCQFDNETLALKSVTASVPGTNYVAISHVWGEARWENIPGLAAAVLVSDEKAKFLRDKLRHLVGSEIFWMDVL